MDLFSQTVNIRLGRGHITKLYQIVMRYHDETNKNTDETIQHALEIINDPEVETNARVLMIERFETVRNQLIGNLLSCMREQDAIVAEIDRQLIKEHESLDKEEDAIAQLCDLKATIQNQRKANFNKFKQIEGIVFI